MFDISGDEISLLSDEDLRELVGRLCQADLRENGLSPLAVTYSGHLSASDGGIDIRVAVAADIPLASDIPRANVGYQIKAEDTPPRKILSEMRPGGCLRARIRELATISGAYILVSSKGSVSDSALRARKAAMSEAVAELPNARDLHLDFYDRGRIATWVRRYPGIVAWVRERIGRAFSGWRAFGDWSSSNENPGAAYLVDDAVRIQGPGLRGKRVSAVEGISAIRDILTSEHGIVRLVGLSGTGKTRLAEALFDQGVGQNSLPSELAIYTNLSDDPQPQPVAVATDLVAQHRRQVLIVDNCTPELHGRLSKICGTMESRVSLLTIEYDVREDQPEGTDVFELQPSSDDLIEKLLLRRVPKLSQVNANSIARFAGGNARVALALASTVESGESVASLRDAELFERLFRQRQESSGSILLSAQACSLPYSFEVEDKSGGPGRELSVLAATVGKDVRSLHADIAELKRRDLVQQRGVWRAVLPHAIANRLAAWALESFLPQDFEFLLASAPTRLQRSISRRLGYLHTSDAAQRIVSEWVAEGGRLGRVEDLDDDGKAMFANVAPVAPHSVLDAIERAARRQRDIGRQLKGEEFRSLLVSLAFESELFDHAVALILDLSEFEELGRNANQVRSSFGSLFQLYLSGTHATLEQRIRVIDALLSSNSQARQDFGFAALDSMFESSHFTSHHPFEFGGRPRDYGYHPRTREEVLAWFRAALDLCAKHDARDIATSSRIRAVISKNLRSLWNHLKMFDEIGAICRQFHARRFWPEALMAIRSIRRFQREPCPEHEEARLAAIEAAIAPGSLVEAVRAQVLRNVHDVHLDIDFEDYEAQFARQQSALIELGKLVAVDSSTFEELQPDLTACSTAITLGAFAKGLYEAANDRRATWDRLVESFASAEPAFRSTELLTCYLFNLQSAEPDFAETLLEEIFQDPRLSEWFPVIQARLVISKGGVSRLKKSLERQSAPAERFWGLAYSRNSGLDDGAVLELTPLLLKLEGGFPVALNIIWMQLPHGQQRNLRISPELIAAGQLIGEAFEFERRTSHDEYALGQVIEFCLSSEEAIPTVHRMLERLKAKHSEYGFSSISDDDALGALVAAQPLIVLDALFGSNAGDQEVRRHRRLIHYDHLQAPFNRIPSAVLLPWCDMDPIVRYPLAASVIKAFEAPRNSNERQWNHLAIALLEHAPDRIEVMKSWIDQLCPMAWSGSRAAAWEANLQLLDTFENHPDANLAAFVRSEREQLKRAIDELKQQELEYERRQNERFE